MVEVGVSSLEGSPVPRMLEYSLLLRVCFVESEESRFVSLEVFLARDDIDPLLWST